MIVGEQQLNWGKPIEVWWLAWSLVLGIKIVFKCNFYFYITHYNV